MRIKDMLSYLMTGLDNFAANQSRATTAILKRLDEMEPAVNVEASLTDDQLGQIIARVTDPLSIPARVAEHIAEMARHAVVQQRETVGYGHAPIIADWEFRPNGEIDLRLFTINGDPFWRGTFRGPDA